MFLPAAYTVRRSCSNAMRAGAERDVSVKLRFSCFAIGVCHLVLLFFCLYERIWELFKLEEPFIVQDHTVLLISYVAQLLSILLLIFGSLRGNSYYILPWLICATLLFSSGTVYAFLYVSQEETSQMFLNFIVVGIIWSTWYIVIKFHMENRSSMKNQHCHKPEEDSLMKKNDCVT